MQVEPGCGCVWGIDMVSQIVERGFHGYSSIVRIQRALLG